LDIRYPYMNLRNSRDMMTPLLKAVEQYYESRITKYGATCRGVDWSDEETQTRRFETIFDLVQGDSRDEILDVGCGYGAFLGFLRNNGFDGTYVGIDISASMISAAKKLYGQDSKASFMRCGPSQVADYSVVVASGLFNVRAGTEPQLWTNYVNQTVERLAQSARSRMVLNFLSLHSDREKRDSDLHYESIGRVSDLLAHHIGRTQRIRQDYGLYEFTISAERD